MTSEEFINRKALNSFQVLEKLEAGIVLTGAEVKALRLGRLNFSGSYITFQGMLPKVMNLNIGHYSKSPSQGYNPKRERNLLLHHRESKRLRGLSEQKGIALIPLRVYFKNNLVKLEVGVARGKKKHDRREDLKNQDITRDIEVALRGKM